MNEEFNPNGSYHAIDGITSPDGRVLGKMGHSERRDSYVGINIYGQKDQKIFESGVEYFKQNIRYEEILHSNGVQDFLFHLVL